MIKLGIYRNNTDEPQPDNMVSIHTSKRYVEIGTSPVKYNTVIFVYTGWLNEPKPAMGTFWYVNGEMTSGDITELVLYHGHGNDVRDIRAISFEEMQTVLADCLKAILLDEVDDRLGINVS